MAFAPEAEGLTAADVAVPVEVIASTDDPADEVVARLLDASATCT